jgi:hypothetical protein
MSKGPDRIEAAITELFKGTKDRASSISDITRHGFGLNGAEPTRAQRLSATRAAHRILKRANNAFDAADAAWPGRFPRPRRCWARPA